jgi:hypothetical protein
MEDDNWGVWCTPKTPGGRAHFVMGGDPLRVRRFTNAGANEEAGRRNAAESDATFAAKYLSDDALLLHEKECPNTT